MPRLTGECDWNSEMHEAKQQTAMNRTPEPELMTGEDQAVAYTGADLSEIHQPMVDYFKERLGDLRGGKLLDLGCGGADMTIRFVKAFPGLEALAVDGSEAMLRCARAAVGEAGLTGRINMECRHLPDATLATRSLDAVIANSLLHHVADPVALWRMMRDCGRPGAAVMVMDLRRPADPLRAQELVEHYGAAARPVLRRDFFNSLCAAYTAAEIREQLNEAGLPHFEVQEISDLQVLAWGRVL